ncbi:acetate kinase [Clostridium sp.]|uniref:acetate kinase n=1 Tax=Clostridium sp. TaxID=1506 RepID=UPI003F319598
MKVLVINCGSSSLKYQLIDMANEESLAQGLVERIGIEGSVLTQKVEGRDKYIVKQPMADHKVAIGLVLEALVNKENGVISSMDEIAAVGHRVVHGGEKYNESVIIDKAVKDYIKECFKLAPLHNPANMIGIEACEELMPNTPMVAVFDTAFHGTMPEESYLYALPYELYEKHGIRKYGFHGTSHKYVSQKVAEVMGKDVKDLKIVTCHLGNGSSCCAVKGGVSVDTSMGFTPLEGLAMGTRSGSIDPAIVTFLMKEEGLSIDEVNDLLNKKSGALGISGISSDFRDIEDAAFKNDVHRAKLALKIFEYKIRATIGSYAAIMGGVDVIVFTAGVGENGPETREEVLKGLEFLGVELDKERNAVRGKVREISKEGCKVKAFVIPTNEELMIAKDTVELVQK